MNKERNKIIFAVLIVILGLAFYLFGYKKSEVMKTSIETPTEETKEQTPVTTPETINEGTNKQTLFNNKMKEANGYFVKGDYKSAVIAYNQALAIQKSEYVYAGLYSAYLALKDYPNAERSILLAIEQDSKSSDYWSWYLVLLSDAMKAPRAKLDAVYNDSLNKVSGNKKINVITQYAHILENLGDFSGAIGEWQRAITINPDRASVYQSEIDNLKTRL